MRRAIIWTSGAVALCAILYFAVIAAANYGVDLTL
jgi:hypothetical protein